MLVWVSFVPEFLRMKPLHSATEIHMLPYKPLL